MFSLMDKVPNGIEPMLKDLEEHIMSAGLADMVASAETITSVRHVQTYTGISVVLKYLTHWDKSLLYCCNNNHFVMLKNLPNDPDIMLLKEKANMLIMCGTLFYQDSEKYVEQLLTLFNRFSRLVKEAFQDDPRFLTARDKVSATFTSLTIDSTQQWFPVILC